MAYEPATSTPTNSTVISSDRHTAGAATHSPAQVAANLADRHVSQTDSAGMET